MKTKVDPTLYEKELNPKTEVVRLKWNKYHFAGKRNPATTN